MSIINLLASRNFIVVNKEIAKKIGLDEAIMIGELASEYSYWEDKDGITEDGFFFSTVENVQENTTFTQYKQQRTLDKLKELGLVYVERRDVPAKRYIRLREDNIAKLFAGKEYEYTQKEEPKKEKVDYKPEFEEIWKKYPKKQGKSKAEEAYAKARKGGVTREIIEAGLDRYVSYVTGNNVDDRYIKNGSTWFNQACWNDEYKTYQKSPKNSFRNMSGRDWNFDELEKMAAEKVNNFS